MRDTMFRPRDRRRHQRAHSPAATALVFARTHSAVFSVEDVSSGGARLVGRFPLACGELITVTFEVDRVPFVLAAVVVRLEILSGPRDAVAIAFRDVSPVAQLFLQRLVVRTLSHGRPSTPAEAIE